MARLKPLLIDGPLEDLGDVLHIARVEGKKVLKTERVKVKPYVQTVENGYVVLVEPDGSGCSKASGVGSKNLNEK